MYMDLTGATESQARAVYMYVGCKDEPETEGIEIGSDPGVFRLDRPQKERELRASLKPQEPVNPGVFTGFPAGAPCLAQR